MKHYCGFELKPPCEYSYFTQNLPMGTHFLLNFLFLAVGKPLYMNSTQYFQSVAVYRVEFEGTVDLLNRIPDGFVNK
jgi:hypothetical protein